MTLYYMSARYSFTGWLPHRTRVGYLYATAAQAEANRGHGCCAGAVYTNWRLESATFEPNQRPIGYIDNAGNYAVWREGGAE